MPPIRYLPELVFPPYTHVPGASPHPVTDPRGHSYQIREAPGPPLKAESWRRCRSYLRGIDLFNHGYYWEAHESWEQLWIAAGRAGATADFLKGLIKLAAAGVKFREGNPVGATRHLDRAAELFQMLAGESRIRFGLDLNRLLAGVDHLPLRPDQAAEGAAFPVFDFVLELQA